MTISGHRHKFAKPAVGARLLSVLVVPWALAVSGCGAWDDFRACDYSVRAYFKTEDPLEVLKTSSDGTKRARALGELREPKQGSGNDEQHDLVVGLLIRSASEEPHAIARVEAIKTLGTFKDPRAVKGLKDAFYAAERFPSPEIRSHVRIQSMNALGRIGDGAAVDLLVDVLRAPPIEAAKSSDAEQQMNLDERLAAAEALSGFKNSRATEALVQVLKSEKDVALRNTATKSLQTATGKKLPDDVQAWEDALYGEKPASRVADERPRLMPPIIRTGATQRSPR